MVLLLNRLAVVLALAGAIFFVMRGGGQEAVSESPEALWESGVDNVDAMISDEAHGTLHDSMTYAEDFGSDVGVVSD